MSTAISRVEIRCEEDVVQVRRRARRVANLLGFDRSDQTRIATAVSEIARNAYQYAGSGEVEFMLKGVARSQVFAITVRDGGPGIKDVQAILEGRFSSSTGMGIGIVGSCRLVDQFHIDTEIGKGTLVSLGATLPPTQQEVTPTLLKHIGEALAVTGPESPLEEAHIQNQELLRAMQELRGRREELEVTNRGVVALYTELDTKILLLRESEARFRRIFEQSPVAYQSLDALERILEVNPAWLALFGYTRDEVIGRRMTEFITPASQALLAEEFARFRECGVTHGVEFEVRRKDGNVLTVSNDGVFVRDAQNRPSYSHCVLHNISERKSLEFDLARARTMETIGMITGGVAHEVRNPLNSIQIMAAVLEKKLGDDPDIRQCVAHIKEQIQRLSMLMNDLLLLGRPADSAGFVPCDLRAVAISAARFAEGGVAGSDGRVRVRSDGPVPQVVGDSAKLEQVLINLLQNALTISPKGTPVGVEVSLEDGMVQIRVQDQGTGIAPEFFPRLFQPFQSKRKGGTGLGLAIVQKILTDHGGSVEARNNEPAPGATFIVRLPVGI